MSDHAATLQGLRRRCKGRDGDGDRAVAAGVWLQIAHRYWPNADAFATTVRELGGVATIEKVGHEHVITFSINVETDRYIAGDTTWRQYRKEVTG